MGPFLCLRLQVNLGLCTTAPTVHWFFRGWLWCRDMLLFTTRVIRGPPSASPRGCSKPGSLLRPRGRTPPCHGNRASSFATRWRRQALTTAASAASRSSPHCPSSCFYLCVCISCVSMSACLCVCMFVPMSVCACVFVSLRLDARSCSRREELFVCGRESAASVLLLPLILGSFCPIS